MSLQDRGRAAYRAFDTLYRQEGIPPTVREVMGEMGLTSTSTVVVNLQAAVELGLLVHRPGKYIAYMPIHNDQAILRKVRQLAEGNLDVPQCRNILEILDEGTAHP